MSEDLDEGADYAAAVEYSAKKHNGSQINSPFREWTRDDFLEGRKSRNKELKAELDTRKDGVWRRHFKKDQKSGEFVECDFVPIKEIEKIYDLLDRANSIVKRELPSHVVWIGDYESLRNKE